MWPSEKVVKSMQEWMEKETGKPVSYEEAEEASRNFINFCEHLGRMVHGHQLREERLKKEPKGFHLEGGPYSCCICGASISNEQTWYDAHGLKCPLCQRGLENKIIPTSACRDKDSWYSIGDLRSYYNVHWATARKLVKQGKLKARIVLDNAGKPYFYLFLIEENAPVLGPKPQCQTTHNSDGTCSFTFPEPQVLPIFE